MHSKEEIRAIAEAASFDDAITAMMRVYPKKDVPTVARLVAAMWRHRSLYVRSFKKMQKAAIQDIHKIAIKTAAMVKTQQSKTNPDIIVDDEGRLVSETINEMRLQRQILSEVAASCKKIAETHEKLVSIQQQTYEMFKRIDERNSAKSHDGDDTNALQQEKR